MMRISTRKIKWGYKSLNENIAYAIKKISNVSVSTVTNLIILN